MKEEIRRRILQALPEIEKMDEIEVVEPKNKEYGDFSSNVALKMAKKLGKNPMELAKCLAENIKTEGTFAEVKAVPPGFINFYIGEEWLYKAFEAWHFESLPLEVKKDIRCIVKAEEAGGCIQEILRAEENKRLQYAHSRICSVLRILKAEGICLKNPGISFDYHGSDVEKDILRQIMDYHRMIQMTFEKKDCKILLEYMLTLGAGFYRYHEGILFRSLKSSLLYGTLRVMDGIRLVIKDLLDILGLDAPEKS